MTSQLNTAWKCPNNASTMVSGCIRATKQPVLCNKRNSEGQWMTLRQRRKAILAILQPGHMTVVPKSSYDNSSVAEVKATWVLEVSC